MTYYNSNTENTDRKMGILKTEREKGQVKYQDRPIRITSDYLTTNF